MTASSSRIRPTGCADGTFTFGDHDRLDEFVGDVLFVAALERGDRIVGAGFGFAMNQRAVGQLDALPAIVAVHRVVAADERGDFADLQLAHFLLELAHEVAAAVRRSVAAVHEAVDENFLDLLLLGQFEQREEMRDVGVHAAVAEQADEVELALAAALHGLLEQRNEAELLVGDEQFDAGDVHVHDATGADVEVADFASCPSALRAGRRTGRRCESACSENLSGACRRSACALARWRCLWSRRGSPSRRGR